MVKSSFGLTAYMPSASSFSFPSAIIFFPVKPSYLHSQSKLKHINTCKIKSETIRSYSFFTYFILSGSFVFVVDTLPHLSFIYLFIIIMLLTG
jgi:hypothetical protein